jgi:hypothetical protein
MKHAFQLPAWPLVAIAALAMVAAYANGLRGTFVMDDVPAIVDNESIRTLWPPWVPTFEGGALAHRPLPYFTFALNHAIHRLELPGYHAVNIGLHCLNGVLMGLIVTHVLRLAGWRQPPHIPAEWVGAAAACDWIVLRTKPRDLVTKRLPLYAGLFACWPLVVVIVRLQADRYPESQGIGYGPLAYLANQPAVIVLYLRLAAWPTKLCFDYGWPCDSTPFSRRPRTRGPIACWPANSPTSVGRRMPCPFCETRSSFSPAIRSPTRPSGRCSRPWARWIGQSMPTHAPRNSTPPTPR